MWNYIYYIPQNFVCRGSTYQRDSIWCLGLWELIGYFEFRGQDGQHLFLVTDSRTHVLVGKDTIELAVPCPYFLPCENTAKAAMNKPGKKSLHLKLKSLFWSWISCPHNRKNSAISISVIQTVAFCMAPVQTKRVCRLWSFGGKVRSQCVQGDNGLLSCHLDYF